LDPNVVLFCGGRGSASIIRELLSRPRIRLSLLVNAYDDGLSTGALRDLVQGMLGPSDFRKNLSYLLDLYSAQQYALQQMLEYRLPKDADDSVGASIKEYVRTGVPKDLPPPLGAALADLDGPMRKQIVQFLRVFFEYVEGKGDTFHYADCSFGNLIFAGAYLKMGSFNAAYRELAKICGSQAELINVSRGECRTLVALKEDGQLLCCEAEIVGPQSGVPIRDLFFFERRPCQAELDEIKDRSLDEKEAWLRARQLAVEISDEARQALRKADIIIFGPGTQHSSLFPSYRIARDAVRTSPARVKGLVLNLHVDHDIQGLKATDLIDRVLTYLGDPTNEHQVITHALWNRASGVAADGIALAREKLDVSSIYRGVQVIFSDLQNPIKPRVHNGYSVANRIVEVFEDGGLPGRLPVLDIYVDLLGRIPGLDALTNEFQELNWQDHFERVHLRINKLAVPKLDLPAHLKIDQAEYPHEFSEGQMLRDWLIEGQSDYLATLTGDGEYRLRDVLFAVNLIKSGEYGVVFGSRLQSRRQFHSSLRSAYGEGGVLYGLSWLWAFVVSAISSMRFGIMLSDPLTGFRVYKRSRLHPEFVAAVRKRQPMTTGAVTNMLITKTVEIAEIPVIYRTFSGFAKPRWRVSRAVRNLPGIVFGVPTS
jgi:2-phospho-L-lactate transferase/gluconeogenesis factor (CofD/UPF0052 family)